MSVDIRKHPDSPDPALLEDILVEPIPRDEIERKRDEGKVLVEDNVREREDLNVIAYLSSNPDGSEDVSVGVGLYRLVQLFGTPQMPEYQAGEDISFRTDEVFKYLFRAHRQNADEGDELPEEWLFTVHDSHVRWAASVAEWRDDDEEFTANDQVALTSYMLAQKLGVEPVESVYEDVIY